MKLNKLSRCAQLYLAMYLAMLLTGTLSLDQLDLYQLLPHKLAKLFTPSTTPIHLYSPNYI